MDVEDQEDNTTEEAYVFLDFGNVVKEDIFQDKIFLRIANLETDNPLIQLNDHLFKGKYEDCVGTNLFFEDVDDVESSSFFHGDTSIHLRHSVTQFKTINLTPVQIPSKLKDIPEPDYSIRINTDCDYDTLLKKFVYASLNVKKDLIKVSKATRNEDSKTPAVRDDENTQKSVASNSTSKKTEELETVTEPTVAVSNDCSFEDQQNNGDDDNDDIEEDSPKPEPKPEFIDILSYKYEKLRKLAMRPNRRKAEPEVVEVCEEKYQKAYEYNSIKSQIIKPSDFFRTISKKFNRETLVGAVDIDRSILQGVIQPSKEYYRVLSEEEKWELLSMDNLDNLSMLARYWVLRSQFEYLRSSKSTMTKYELLEKDKYGRTIDDCIAIFKRLMNVVNGIVEENYFYNSDQDTEDEDASSDGSSIKEVGFSRDLSGNVSDESIE